MNDFRDNDELEGSAKDYIDTVEYMLRELKKTQETPERVILNNNKLYTIPIQPSQVDSWRVRISYSDIFKLERVKWYIRIYRKLFPTRSYINWRVRKYYFKKKYEKLILNIDHFIAWGDEMKDDKNKKT